MKYRLDAELVRRKIARSREDARELIEGGHVLVDGFAIKKPSRIVDESASITLGTERDEFVSRGARKLAGALDHFGIRSWSGKRVLDAGASTGGFTEVALRRGAEKVYAVDVGYGQLAWSLRSHPQVVVVDRTNIRELALDRIESRVDVVVADLSFISLTTVLPRFAELISAQGDMILMVKPQFEVGKSLVGQGGVVRDPDLRAQAVRSVAKCAQGLGFGVRAVVASSVPGPAGNVEYFLWLRRDAIELRESDLSRAIEEGPK